MVKAIEKSPHSTYPQTACGLAEKAIKVRETDWTQRIIPTRSFTERLQSFSPSTTFASRERRIMKLTKVSCFAVNASSVPYVFAKLRCAFCILCICWHLCGQLDFAHQAHAMSLAGTCWKNSQQLLVCATRPGEKMVEKWDWRSCFVQNDWKRSTGNRPGRDPDLPPFASKCLRGVSL